MLRLELWTPVFEKAVKELKQKQKWLECKRTIQRMIFNFWTFNRIGQQPKLTASTIDHNMDIICIQDHRYISYGENIKYHDTGNRWTFVTAICIEKTLSTPQSGVGWGGVAWRVGILIGPRALKSLNSIEKTQPRMMVATFNGNPSTTIISLYSPINVSDETDLIAIYNELSSLVRSIPKHNVLIIGWAMNAQIVKNVNNKFSLHNSLNRNREHQSDLTQENRLTCLNTKFQNRKGKLWFNIYANNAKTQIDNILINKKWNNSTLNCEAYSSFEGVFFDHRIVTDKIRLSLRKNAARTTTALHYDWSLLNNRDISDKYTLTLRNKFEISEILQMTNIRTLSITTKKRQKNAYQLNKKLNLESQGRH